MDDRVAGNVGGADLEVVLSTYFPWCSAWSSNMQHPKISLEAVMSQYITKEGNVRYPGCLPITLNIW